MPKKNFKPFWSYIDFGKVVKKNGKIEISPEILSFMASYFVRSKENQKLQNKKKKKKLITPLKDTFFRQGSAQVT
jgi:hypothetical protein